ncbi:hypothetical protein [Shimia thalassica]|uniref:hypothetical protein n=1 Tax=Shimia thalassica TaxID=1715693 RepID=UPI002495750A|nr:hypothetical protein [Shimia thalassica]
MIRDCLPKVKQQELTPDELGAAGEDLFRALASASRLIANSSERDKKGWDFFVQEAGEPPDTGKPLDQRTEWSCYVQLKSTAEKKGRSVKAKLSTFEPFTKLPGPSLLVVFRLHMDGRPKRGYVIPILDEQLVRVLRRLRQAEAKGEYDLSTKNITFDYRSKGHEFPLSTEGLRAALQKAVGEDPTAYVAEKQLQLRELGYEDAELVGQFAFRVEQEGQLARMWLGLEPINASNLSVFDARFGIPIPYNGTLFNEIEQVKMTPPSIGVWRVSMKGPNVLDEAAVFEVEAHIAPPALGGPVALLKHQDFTIVIQESGIQFETEHVFGDAQRPLDRWCALLRGLSHLADGRGQLSIAFGPTETASFPVSDELNGPNIEDLPRLRDFLEGWQRLVRQAGTIAKDGFSIAEAKENLDAQLAVGLMLDAEPGGYMEFDVQDEVSGEELTGVYFNACSLGGAAVTYSVLVSLKRRPDQPLTFRSVKFDALDVRAKVEDLKAYGRRQAELQGVTVILDPDLIKRV